MDDRKRTVYIVDIDSEGVLESLSGQLHAKHDGHRPKQFFSVPVPYFA